MNDPVFVVLRAQSETVQTVGPAGQAFTSFDEADAFAKEMRDRYTQQAFYLCQAIAVYEVQGRATIQKIALPEPGSEHAKAVNIEKSEPIETSPAIESSPPVDADGPAESSSQTEAGAPPEPGAPNVYPLPARVRAAE